MNEKIRELLNENKQYLLKVRRHLHQNPELSEHEFETQKYIINFLEKYNVEYTILAKTGIYAKIKNGQGKSLAFRADMDALPLIENNNLEFKSKNEGIMHACGHDVHMAVQLTLLKILAENKLSLIHI